MSFMLMMVAVCVGVGVLCPPRTARIVGSLLVSILLVVVVFYLTHLIA